MKRKPGRRRSSRGSGGSDDSRAGSERNVGYGRPPANQRFKKGESGNPKGRPKGSKGFKTILRGVLTSKVVMRVGAKKRRVSIIEAIILKQAENGLKGSDKAALALMKMAGTAGLMDEVSDSSVAALSDAEQEILNELLSRPSKRGASDAE